MCVGGGMEREWSNIKPSCCLIKLKITVYSRSDVQLQADRHAGRGVVMFTCTVHSLLWTYCPHVLCGVMCARTLAGFIWTWGLVPRCPLENKVLEHGSWKQTAEDKHYWLMTSFSFSLIAVCLLWQIQLFCRSKWTTAWTETCGDKEVELNCASTKPREKLA